MRNRQKGFTLIELMIVVTIIGILAAVAVPAYSDYTVRAKVTEAVSAVAPLKASVADYYNATGDLPTTPAQAGISTDDGSGESRYATGVVKSITLDNSIDAGVISVALKAIGGSVTEDDTLIFRPTPEPNGQLIWRCEADAGRGSLPEQYAPGNCRDGSPSGS